MTEYHINGKQLSMKEFKTRISKAEREIKESKFYTITQMWQKHEE